MTVTAEHDGRGVYFDQEDRLWRYQDTKESVYKNWVEKTCPNCKCGLCERESEGVIVILKDGSKTLRFVDKCIANLIKELNLLGIRTTSISCCGHGKEDGKFIIPKKFVKKHRWGYRIRIPRRKINEDTKCGKRR